MILICITVTTTLSQIHKHSQIAITNLQNIDKLLTSVTQLLTRSAPVVMAEKRRENGRMRRGERDGVDAVGRNARRRRSPSGAGVRPPPAAGETAATLPCVAAGAHAVPLERRWAALCYPASSTAVLAAGGHLGFGLRNEEVEGVGVGPGRRRVWPTWGLLSITRKIDRS